MPGPSGAGAASRTYGTLAGCPQCRELIFFWHLYLLQRLSSQGIKPWSIRDSEAPNLKRKDRHYEHPGYTANCHHYLEYRPGSLGCRVQSQTHDDLEREGAISQSFGKVDAGRV